MKKIFVFSLLFALAFSLCVNAEAAVISSKNAYKTFLNVCRSDYLNSNKMSGTAGASDYLENAELRAALTAYIAEKKPATRELLDWFKGKFLLNTGNVLNNRDKGDDKGGIKGAIIAKYKDICYGVFKKESNDAFKAYKTEIAALEKIRKDATKLCVTGYTACVKVLSADEKAIKTESCKNDKDICSNTAYTAYFSGVKTKYDEKLAVKLSSQLSNLKDCLANERITLWQWAQ